MAVLGGDAVVGGDDGGVAGSVERCWLPISWELDCNLILREMLLKAHVQIDKIHFTGLGKKVDPW